MKCLSEANVQQILQKIVSDNHVPVPQVKAQIQQCIDIAYENRYQNQAYLNAFGGKKPDLAQFLSFVLSYVSQPLQ